NASLAIHHQLISANPDVNVIAAWSRRLLNERTETVRPRHQIEYNRLDLLPHAPVYVSRRNDAMRDEDLADPSFVDGSLHRRGAREIRCGRLSRALEDRPEQVRVALHCRRDDGAGIEEHASRVVSLR